MRGTAIVAALLLSVLQAHAALVITEVMPNPAAVTDTYGEWFEVYNDGASSVDMYGYHILDMGSEAVQVTQHVIIPAGGFAVLGRYDDTLLNGGVEVDYAYGTGFSLSNSDDEIIITDDQSQVIDEVAYATGASGWPAVPNGASLYYDWCGDNEPGSCWSAETEYIYGRGDRGTPGYDPRLPSGTDVETWSAIKALYRR
jgi:hypothetical protein